MNNDSAIQFGSDKHALELAPILPEWIIEGTPIARRHILYRTADTFAWMMFWDCTSGRFNWHYDWDESLCFLEGSVLVTDDRGVERRLGPGDTIFFPAGTSAVWHVENYIRKVAFCRHPVPWPTTFVWRTRQWARRQWIKRMARSGGEP